MVFVADGSPATVNGETLLAGDARVEGRALVEASSVGGDVRLYLTTVEGSARVEGNGYLEHSEVRGSAVVSGNNKLRYVEVEGSARVEGNAKLSFCVVSGESHVYGNAVLQGVQVLDNSCVFGNARLVFVSTRVLKLCGSCKFGGDATFDGMSAVEHFVNKYGADKVKIEVARAGLIMSSNEMIILTDVWDMG